MHTIYLLALQQTVDSRYNVKYYKKVSITFKEENYNILAFLLGEVISFEDRIIMGSHHISTFCILRQVISNEDMTRETISNDLLSSGLMAIRLFRQGR